MCAASLANDGLLNLECASESQASSAVTWGWFCRLCFYYVQKQRRRPRLGLTLWKQMDGADHRQKEGSLSVCSNSSCLSVSPCLLCCVLVGFFFFFSLFIFFTVYDVWLFLPFHFTFKKIPNSSPLILD